MFAVVAVNTPVHTGGSAYDKSPQAGEKSVYPGPVFHYHLPPELGAQVVAGTLVEVPFGPRQVQGLVIALADAAPVSETKPVTRLLFQEPVLSQHQIALGLWMSERYYSPLIDCLRLMLPPGLLRRPHPVVHLHPEVPIPEDLPEAQQQVVELLQRYGTLGLGQIARRLGQQRTRRAVRSLTRRGILVQGSDLPAPRTRPKKVNFVRLRASPPQVAAMRPLLGRPSKQAEILNALVQEDDPLPPVSRILAVANASAATLSTMAHKGWIDIELERSLIQALPTAQDAGLDRAPRQRAVLEYLVKQRTPVNEQVLRQASGAATSVLRTMEGRGLIERIVEPPTVILRLDAQEVMVKIGELRGAKRQHRVLDYLLSRSPEEWLWVSWVYAETGCSLKDIRALEGHGLVELAEREVWRDPLAEQSFVLETPPTLTPDQERAWTAIRAQMTAPDQPPPVFLLHGVTGSGKTEIYIRAAKDTLERGHQAIILVPEISLTTQTIRRFAARFSDGLGVIHSRLSDGERYDTWRRIRNGQIRLVIGPRSALFAPLEDIGLIVLDEEHDPSYKQSDRMPAYHARDVALHLAADHRATVLLGSATPDLVTYYYASERHSIQLLELPQRILAHRRHLEEQLDRHQLTQIRYTVVEEHLQDVYAIGLPPVRVLDMRHELRAGNRSIFSRRLQHEMKRSLDNGEQVILFLNRRGASTFVMCRDCGTVIRCPHCDVPLTYHLKGGHLHCHHCNHRQAAPETCPICSSARIKHFGVGTQRVEQALHDLLPTARVLRWDRDTTTEKGSHEALLDRFTQHKADVLIGTQMIAKGLDLPRVTLVGVISADTALNLPDFRAAERTFQLLAQVAGRAGRGPSGGQVIIQTYTPEHYAIQSAARHDYVGFYAQERAFRQQMGYPPFSRLARLVRSEPSLARCRQKAQDLGLQLRERIQRHHLEMLSLIGPAPCFLSRLRGNWRWQIIVRAPSSGTELYTLIRSLTLPPGWQLDIDPLDML